MTSRHFSSARNNSGGGTVTSSIVCLVAVGPDKVHQMTFLSRIATSWHEASFYVPQT